MLKVEIGEPPMVTLGVSPNSDGNYINNVNFHGVPLRVDYEAQEAAGFRPNELSVLAAEAFGVECDKIWRFMASSVGVVKSQRERAYDKLGVELLPWLKGRVSITQYLISRDILLHEDGAPIRGAYNLLPSAQSSLPRFAYYFAFGMNWVHMAGEEEVSATEVRTNYVNMTREANIATPSELVLRACLGLLPDADNPLH